MKLTLKTLPPALNRTYKVSGGRFYKDSEAAATQGAIVWEAKSQYRGQPLKGQICLTVTFYYPNMRKDIDAGINSLLDAFSGVLYEDDKQVEQLHVYKCVSKENPRCELVIEEIGQTPQALFVPTTFL